MWGMRLRLLTRVVIERDSCAGIEEVECGKEGVRGDIFQDEVGYTGRIRNNAFWPTNAKIVKICLGNVNTSRSLT